MGVRPGFQGVTGKHRHEAFGALLCGRQGRCAGLPVPTGSCEWLCLRHLDTLQMCSTSYIRTSRGTQTLTSSVTTRAASAGKGSTTQQWGPCEAHSRDHFSLRDHSMSMAENNHPPSGKPKYLLQRKTEQCTTRVLSKLLGCL